jgi:hypothetical protein
MLAVLTVVFKQLDYSSATVLAEAGKKDISEGVLFAEKQQSQTIETNLTDSDNSKQDARLTTVKQFTDVIHQQRLQASNGPSLGTPDYTAIGAGYFDHKILTGNLISLNDGIYLFIERVQNGPGLRDFILSIMHYPHIITLYFLEINKRRISR